MAEDSEDRTEAATPARLGRARLEGHAPVSHELASFANLAAGLLVMAALAPSLAGNAAQRLSLLLANAGGIDGTAALLAALRQAAGIAVQALLPLALAVLITGAGVVLVQTRLALRLTAFNPDLSRISPMSGFKRLFSANHAVDAAKSILKITVLSLALWFALAGQLEFLPDSLAQHPGAIAARLRAGILAIIAALIAVQAFIALLDVGWTQFNFTRTVRMSREEVKEETRSADGDPHIKAKRRALRQALAKQNLKKAMANATVVVTNPTHYAVALSYVRDSAAAPRIVAKGMDEMAARIRELAAENRIPIVPNPPLARALHVLELESEIPYEHYKAVADIIAYIWRLEAQAARARMI